MFVTKFVICFDKYIYRYIIYIYRYRYILYIQGVGGWVIYKQTNQNGGWAYQSPVTFHLH